VGGFIGNCVLSYIRLIESKEKELKVSSSDKKRLNIDQPTYSSADTQKEIEEKLAELQFSIIEKSGDRQRILREILEQ
jgi:hypothetical protein